ncbi:MAG: cysteine desulfurase [Bacteroidales bacterium]|nr:cysteine desulfurase [Bacteroidales bacterium]
MTFDINKIQKDFPALHQEIYKKPLVYLDNAATTQKPQAVIDRIIKYNTYENSNIHRGVHYLSQEATNAFEQARIFIKEYINAAESHEIIFTKGTTESINIIASSFGKKFLNKDDEIIISTMEHHSNLVPWQQLCIENEAHLKVIPINEKGELLIDEFKKLLNEKTKFVALTHISNALGTINPVKKIIEMAHKFDVPVLIDGAQGIPHLKIDVQNLDCDFYCFSGHKVFAPMGSGVLYGKEKWLEKLPPFQFGGEMVENVTFEKTTFNELPFKFEAGTPNVESILGLETALKYISEIGIKNIADYENDLLNYATKELIKIEGLRIIGTAEKKASVISFLIGNIHPYDAGTIIDRMGVAVRTGHHCAQPVLDWFNIPGTVRASFAFYNTKEDVDKLVEAVLQAKKMLE